MKKLQYYFYRLIRAGVKLFYPKTRVLGTENLPDEPCVIVGNHCQMNGPIVGELYIPGNRYIWCASEMMEAKEVADYAFRDFWRNKPRYIRWFYRLLSHLIVPVSVSVFNNARTIAVYRDRRVVQTFKESLERLEQGANVVIFPEKDTPHDHILCDFQEGFVDLARGWYRKTGKRLKFVPMYLAPELKAAYLCPPVEFDPEVPFKTERSRVCGELMDAISSRARSLPRHKVVPYNNTPRRKYGYNIPEEVDEE